MRPEASLTRRPEMRWAGLVEAGRAKTLLPTAGTALGGYFGGPLGASLGGKLAGMVSSYSLEMGSRMKWSGSRPSRFREICCRSSQECCALPEGGDGHITAHQATSDAGRKACARTSRARRPGRGLRA